jgi:TonB family protein
MLPSKGDVRALNVTWVALALAVCFTQQLAAQCPQSSTESVAEGQPCAKVDPIYPPLARVARVQGTVVLRVTISKTGNVQKVSLVSGHPLLVSAAIDAVKQWKFRPYLSNGSPAKVETAVQVNFVFDQGASPSSQPCISNVKEKSDKIQALLREGKFDEAEPLARECIRQVPADISFLGQLERILNGQGNFREADELRDQVRTLWEKNYKAEWIAKGSPLGESSWTRFAGSSKDYDVFGLEYFVPRILWRGDPALIGYYEVIALPKLGSGPSRLFELDKYANEKDYFLEEFSENAISMAEMYGNKMPDIRTAVRDAISYLDGKKEKRGEFLRKE